MSTDLSWENYDMVNQFDSIFKRVYNEWETKSRLTHLKKKISNRRCTSGRYISFLKSPFCKLIEKKTILNFTYLMKLAPNFLKESIFLLNLNFFVRIPKIPIIHNLSVVQPYPWNQLVTNEEKLTKRS